MEQVYKVVQRTDSNRLISVVVPEKHPFCTTYLEGILIYPKYESFFMAFDNAESALDFVDMELNWLQRDGVEVWIGETTEIRRDDLPILGSLWELSDYSMKEFWKHRQEKDSYHLKLFLARSAGNMHVMIPPKGTVFVPNLKLVKLLTL